MDSVEQNDFDVSTIQHGLDEIDITMDQLEANIPEDIYDYTDLDVDGMLKANRELRDKIKDISDIVIKSIKKAEAMKKEIHTHRDPPEDIEVRSKVVEINNYQQMINHCKKYISNINVKVDKIADQEKLNERDNKIK